MLYLSTEYGQNCLKQEILQFVLSLEYEAKYEDISQEFNISNDYAEEILDEIKNDILFGSLS